MQPEGTLERVSLSPALLVRKDRQRHCAIFHSKALRSDTWSGRSTASPLLTQKPQQWKTTTETKQPVEMHAAEPQYSAFRGLSPKALSSGPMLVAYLIRTSCPWPAMSASTFPQMVRTCCHSWSLSPMVHRWLGQIDRSRVLTMAVASPQRVAAELTRGFYSPSS